MPKKCAQKLIKDKLTHKHEHTYLNCKHISAEDNTMRLITNSVLPKSLLILSSICLSEAKDLGNCWTDLLYFCREAL